MDLLSDILATMKLSGTLYFRTSFVAPWGLDVLAYENVSRFHFVHRGRCHARVSGEAVPILLEQGDLIIITNGAGHVLCEPADAPANAVDQVVADAGFTGRGALVYGEPGSGHETQLICGHFSFDRDARHPLIEALPAHIRIANYGDVAHAWLDHTLRLIGAEAGREQLGSDLIALKLAEIIFAQAIRTFLSNDGRELGVFAGFADANICRALGAMHRDPSQTWTLEGLAREAGLSRTSFAKRFSETMAMTPLDYLTRWRMQVARRLLLETQLPMIDIAERSGYRSEASFGRIFKRHFDQPPGGYRRYRASVSAGIDAAAPAA